MNTLPVQNPSAVIDGYIKDYTRKYPAFCKVAEYLASVCRSELETSAIMSSVSSRAKDPRRYANKLNKWEEDKKTLFKDDTHIEEEIKDIIGVRITLYFPSQSQEVMSTLVNLFGKATAGHDVKDWTDLPKPLTTKELTDALAKDAIFLTNAQAEAKSEIDGKKPQEVGDYKSQYGAYRALHMRFELNKDDLGTELRKDLGKRRVKVEIQVQSLLMHAWSEVYHDIVYKPLLGKLSNAEYRMLDILNGVGKVGEATLAALKLTLDHRRAKSKENIAFLSAFELAELMRSEAGNALRDPKNPTASVLGDVQSLLDLLEFIKQDAPTFMKGYMAKWKTAPPSKAPIVNGIFDQIMTGQVVEVPLTLHTPFLLKEHNAFPVLQAAQPLPRGKEPAGGSREGKGSKTDIGNEDDKTPHRRIAASIIDMTLRPYSQIANDKSDKVDLEIMTLYKSLRNEQRLWDDTRPVMPQVGYPVNVNALANKQTVLDLDKLVGTLSKQAAQVALLQYHLRLARIKTFNILTDYGDSAEVN